MAVQESLIPKSYTHVHVHRLKLIHIHVSVFKKIIQNNHAFNSLM